jgi:hypothetical protein
LWAGVRTPPTTQAGAGGLAGLRRALT